MVVQLKMCELIKTKAMYGTQFKSQEYVTQNENSK